MKFKIECEIKERWIPHFLGMLKLMEYDGNIGHSEIIAIFSDGDGDFNPKFKWDKNLPKIKNQRNYTKEELLAKIKYAIKFNNFKFFDAA